jgi:hypothetical protein
MKAPRYGEGKIKIYRDNPWRLRRIAKWILLLAIAIWIFKNGESNPYLAKPIAVVKHVYSRFIQTW